jgi:hypothetical protein
MLALADGTAAWRAETGPFLEKETALSAKGRFCSQTCRMDGPFNVLQMIKSVSLFNPEQFGNLSQVKAFSFQSLCNPFPQRRHFLSMLSVLLTRSHGGLSPATLELTEITEKISLA